MRVSLAIACACALALLAGCGGDDQQPQPQGAAAVSVAERDFRISAPDRLQAGEVRLDVANRGPVAHELIVARAGRAGLPLRDDGITVDEDALGDRLVGALEPAQPGLRSLDVDLAPGRYVMFCNMSGHFKGGMRTEVEVQ